MKNKHHSKSNQIALTHNDAPNINTASQVLPRPGPHSTHQSTNRQRADKLQHSPHVTQSSSKVGATSPKKASLVVYTGSDDDDDDNADPIAALQQPQRSHSRQVQFLSSPSRQSYSRSHKSRAHKTTNAFAPAVQIQAYVNSVCRFSVNARANIDDCNSNSDVLVPWECVECVHMFVSTEASCPICLDAPVSARITLCGHVFCFACILHYIAVCADSVSVCPLCEHYISRSELRSVNLILSLPMSVSSLATFVLVRKHTNGSLAAMHESVPPAQVMLHLPTCV
jgi:hypothetical protein